MTVFKKAAVIAAISLCAVSGAFAQSAKPADNGGIHGVVGFGATFGGEDLVTVVYTDGKTATLKSGGVVQFKGGMEFGLAKDWALQTTIGYHFDKVNASNGSVTFQRFPLEGIVFYSVAPQFRIGAGLRKALSPKLSGTGFVSGSADLGSKVGVVLEGEYLPTPSLGITVRAVSEKYTVGNESFNGNHGGIGLNYHF
jgi:hypothetical protein